MKSLKTCSMVLIMLLYANTIFAAGGGLVNGSFEVDKWIPDIIGKEPNGWDVNTLDALFGGLVSSTWSTDGSFSLIQYANSYVTFEANDMMTVSQQVYLWDVNSIYFDLKLDTDSVSSIWDTNKRTAAVLIDGKIVWSSDIFAADARGVYLDQVIDVNIVDHGLHTLSLALISDIDEDWLSAYTMYYAYWDNIGFDMVCNGMGFGGGDFNMDCRVDINDFCTLADLWMSEVELDSAYNLSHVEDSHQQQGIINFCDYAIWAQGWDPNDVNDVIDVNQLQEIQSIWLSEVPSNSAWNLYKGDDSQGHGIINTDDLVIFVENWLRGVLP